MDDKLAVIKPLTYSGDTSDLTQEAILFANDLHSTLDIETLLELMLKALRSTCKVQGLLYKNMDESLVIRLGETTEQYIDYRLILMQENIGSLKLYFSQPLAETVINSLEILLKSLITPLNNSLLYRHALKQKITDPLTGLNDRSAFDRLLAREVDIAKRYKLPLAALFLDLDFFKNVNDEYGHLIGDMVLKLVSDCISSCVRSSDIVCRYGGEEFTILLRNTDRNGCILLADRLRESIATLDFKTDTDSFSITVSIGVAFISPNDSERSLIQRADEALYIAKNSGRNQIFIAENPENK